jgi:hypothetical protein
VQSEAQITCDINQNEESMPGKDESKLVPENDPEKEPKEESDKEALDVPIEDSKRCEQMICTNVADIVQERIEESVCHLNKEVQQLSASTAEDPGQEVIVNPAAGQEKHHPLIDVEVVEISDDDFVLAVSDDE